MKFIINQQKVRSLLLFCLLLFHQTIGLGGDRADIYPASAQFIAISDIHFNPFYSCKKLSWPCPLIKQLMSADYHDWSKILQASDSRQLAPPGSDTNYALLRSSFAELHRISQQDSPKFILLTGDFLGHHFKFDYRYYSGDFSADGYQHFVKKVFQFLTFNLQQQCEAIPIYPVIGNNDSYHGHYYVKPQGAFFSDLTAIWLPLLKDKNNQHAFAQRFPFAGYYAITPPNEKQHLIIVLDSAIFSTYVQGPNLQAAAKAELLWLNKKLDMAQEKQQKVWLVLHIPVGIDAYTTLHSLSYRFPFLEKIFSFWYSTATNRFLVILQQHENVIQGIISGHLHMDGFALLGKDNTIPDIFVPAISPIFGNRPSYKVIDYDTRNFQLQNFTTYYLPASKNTADKATWKAEYNFNQTYQPHCSHCTLLSGMKKITAYNALATLYQRYYQVGAEQKKYVIFKQGWPYYWCAIKNPSQSSYKHCLNNPR